MLPPSLVRAFHRAFGHPAPTHPALVPDPDLVRLRMVLIKEEYEEVMEELGKLLALQRAAASGKIPAATITQTYQNLLKELADLRYVVDGAAISLGLPIEEAAAEVHRSNMSKLGRDGKPVLRADGKVLKGPDYSEADMTKLVHPIIDGKAIEQEATT